MVPAYHLGAAGARRPGGCPEHHRGVYKGGLIGLIPYSVPEIRRVLNLLGLEAAQRAFHLHWSRWRQQQHRQAQQAHIQRRMRQLATVSSASASAALELLPAALAIADYRR